MNTKWSKEIQSSEVLYYSRVARFNEDNKNSWFKLLGIKDGMKVLEVGCGPGHFSNMVKKHFPNCSVFGMDLDDNHIAFAKEKAKELGLDINYMTGDVSKMPFNDNEFDLIYSHTLTEHLPFEAFITDQKRVVKEGGKIVFMIVDPKGKHLCEYKYLNDKIDEVFNKLEFVDQENFIGKYVQLPNEFLESLQKSGLKKEKLEFAEIMFYFPDLCGNKDIALKQIKMRKEADFYETKFVLSKTKNGKDYEAELINLIEQKYEHRQKLLLDNTKIYDYESTALAVYSAEK